MNEIRRWTALAGLAVLGIIGYQIATGSLTIVDAAWRSGGCLAMVLILREALPRAVLLFARTLEPHTPDQS